MAAKKQSSTRRNTNSSRKPSTKKRTTRKQEEEQSFGTEILLLVILAISILLILSYLGVCGVAGQVISTVMFGVMGLMTYVFPIFLFIGSVFLVSNKGNKLAYKKMLAAVIFFIFMCGILQLLTEGYMRNTTIADYYSLSSMYHTGGGVLGGAICISTTSAFGVAGGYVIMILVLLICLVIITQRSFFGFFSNLWDSLSGAAKDRHERYIEGQPERDLKKEIRMKEKRAKREAKLDERLKRVEAELSDLDDDDDEIMDLSPESVTPLKDDTQKEKDVFTMPSFLDGTKLSDSAFPTEKSEKTSAKTTAKTSAKSSTKTAAKTSVKTLDDDIFAPTLSATENKEGQMEFQIHRSEPVYDDDMTVDDLLNDDSSSAFRNVDSNPIEEQPPVMEEVIPENVMPEEVLAETPSADTAASKSVRNPRSSQEEIDNGINDIKNEITQQKEQKKKAYVYPPMKLLKRGDGKTKGDSTAHLKKTAQKLQDTLHSFGVNVTVTDVSCGPTVTRYELQPEQGVKVSRIVSLADDIKLNLATPDIRIEAPIPGKAAVGIEVPNKENHAVMLRELLQSEEFQKAKSKLSFAVGKDIAGKPVVTDIAKMPHVLIAGATGSGKSVCINTLIISLLYKSSPEEVKMIMIDPKVVELSVYNGIPHLLIPVVTDPKKAAGSLNWAVTEMMSRYNTFAEFHVRNLEEYNHKVENMTIPEGEERPEKMPQIVIIVDELADLMMVAPGEVEDAICRLAQLARAAGLHLVIATQRPSVNVITGLIKANMPSRIAFSVSSGVDSRTILDMNGAEKLLGKGDMLFYPQGYQKPARLQGAFVSDEEVSDIVSFLANKNPQVEYSAEIEQQVNTVSIGGAGSSGEDRDTYFVDAGKFIIEKEKASIGMLQRMFKIGFNRAARIMDQLCDAGVVGPEEGTKPRKVLMSMEEFEQYIEEYL